MLDMGGSEYAFKKLKRWRGEGPTDRNRKMARFLVDRGDLSASSWSRALSDRASLLIDLALEWNDFAMWEKVLKKTTTESFTTQPGLGLLIQAWGVFTFDSTKHMLVHSTLVPMPHSITHLSCHTMHFAESRRLFTASLTQRLRSSLSALSGVVSLPKIKELRCRG